MQIKNEIIWWVFSQHKKFERKKKRIFDFCSCFVFTFFFASTKQERKIKFLYYCCLNGTVFIYKWWCLKLCVCEISICFLCTSLRRLFTLEKNFSLWKNLDTVRMCFKRIVKGLTGFGKFLLNFLEWICALFQVRRKQIRVFHDRL